MDLTARDVMTADVFTVTPGLSLAQLEAELGSRMISGAPVVEHRKLLGVVSRSDVDRAFAHERSLAAGVATFYWDPEAPVAPSRPDPTDTALERLRSLTVRDVMTTEVISVPPDAPVPVVARTLHERRIHRVLVVEAGEIRGLVSSLDLVRVLAGA